MPSTSIVTGFDEPIDAVQLARAFRLWLLDQFELHCGGGVDSKSAEFNVELEVEDVAITFESVTAELLRTAAPPAGKTAYWLDDAEAELIESHRKLKKGKRRRKPPADDRDDETHHNGS